MATNENAKKLSSSRAVIIAIDCNSNGSLRIAQAAQTSGESRP